MSSNPVREMQIVLNSEQMYALLSSALKSVIETAYQSEYINVFGVDVDGATNNEPGKYTIYLEIRESEDA